MTTIAANKKSMACDLQFTYKDHIKFKGKTKVFLFDHAVCKEIFNASYAYIGFAGNVDQWGEAINWLLFPTEPIPRLRKVELLCLTSRGDIYHGSSLDAWMRLEVPHFAIGSGGEFALAAMTAGKTPYEAVKVAAKHDVLTGMGYQNFVVGTKT